MYSLSFLPVALDDMTEIVRYIAKDLSNPKAADRLADEFIDKAEGLKEFPFRNPAYRPIKPLKHEYRTQAVKNYVMFYFAAENQVNIARIVYARRNFDGLLDWHCVPRSYVA